MADINVKKTKTSGIETMQKKIESLQNISSSSVEPESPTNEQLEEIVNRTLDKIVSVSRGSDLNVNDAVELITPKVKCELYLNDELIKDITFMKDSLNTYMKQMEVVDQDIADIYLDLHNIYKKLERSDGSRRLSSANREKLSRRVQESEDLQKRSRHYLTNDAKELSAMLVEPPQEPKIDLN